MRQSVRALLWGMGRAPDRAVLPLGAALGALLYALLPRHRRAARANLSRVFGVGFSPAGIEELVRRNFRHLGQAIAEFLKMAYWDKAEIERRVELRGTEHLDAALAAGKGAICVTAHYGNWELLAARVSQAGYPLHVIARRADDPAVTALMNRVRERSGYRVILRSRRHGIRPALECLRRNELLGILLDQNKGEGAVYVDFFGAPVATPAGPAVLARRTGAPLIPIFDRRRPDGTHVAQVLPALEWSPTGEPDRDTWEITARLTRIIEAQVRAEPEQWFWIYDRWKQTGKARPGSRPFAPVDAASSDAR